ncbi:MAG TPA: hypothetical protein DD658_09920 [Deltaproteobacteria bacterium]|nr:MAG: hypothetical protein A2X88_05245 [Deltaproteobacteria bacterium GWC2_65_14]HBO70403.1 hypothetical protein [Deltaproteobacteria bacterium]
MKKLFPAMLAILFSVSVHAGENGLVTIKSRHSVADTMDRMEAVVQSKGMTVFARIDHGAEAKTAGLSMRPAQLLIFGNPKGGTPLMNASPTVAIDLPLKALAWEDGNGKVWLSCNSAAYLRDRHGIRGMEDLLGTLEKGLDGMTRKALE